MPQGDIGGAGGGAGGLPAPARGRYARRVAAEAAAAGRVFHTISSIQAALNPNFVSALPRMTRNVESMAAGKLVAGGSGLRTGELKRMAEAELERTAARRKLGGKLDIIAAAARRRHVKGMRGVLESGDLAELAKLTPALRTQLDTAEAARAAAAKFRHAHAGTHAPGAPGDQIGRAHG